MSTAYDVPESIRDAVASAQEYLDQLKIEADAAADRLETFSIQSPTFVEFEPEESFSPQRPTDYGLASIGELERASLLLDPDFFNPEKFKSHTYVSTFFDFLEPKLEEFITEESTGISTEVQDAIFNNQRERDLQILSDALLKDDANEGRKGFPLPTDMAQAARALTTGRYHDTRDNRNRETTALIAERAQQNVHHSIDAGIRMEDIQSQFTRFFHQMYMDYNRVLLDKFRVETDANIASLRGKLDKANAGTNLNQMEMQGDLKYRDQLMEKWRVSETMAIWRTRDLIAQAEEATRIQVEAARALTDYYRTIVAGVAGQTNTITVASDSTTAAT